MPEKKRMTSATRARKSVARLWESVLGTEAPEYEPEVRVRKVS